MTPTKESLQKMIADPDCIKVVNALFEAIAYAETVRSIIEPKQQELIDFFKFKVKPEFMEIYINRGYTEHENIITKYRNLYEASEEDCELFYKEMHKFHIEQGFKVEMNYCPLLIAESMVREVKFQVVNILEPYMGVSFDQISWKLTLYKQYIEIIMKTFASAVKEYQKTNAIKEKV